MPQFIIAYHGGRKLDSAEEEKAHRQRWIDWVQGLGPALVNPGTPLGESWTVSDQGASEGAENPLTGFSVVEADTLQAALTIAQDCPFCEIGTLEVAEMRSMG